MHDNSETGIDQIILTSEQIELLETPPAPEDYTIRSDNKRYLKIEYFRAKADQIFGQGRWSVYQDIETQWRVIRHPVTEKVISETCSASVTFRGEGCLPISAVGTVQVQFARDKTTGDILPGQSDQIYLIAERAAKARAFKDALAYLGPAFVCELKPKSVTTGTSSYNKTSKSAVSTPASGSGSSQKVQAREKTSTNGVITTEQLNEIEQIAQQKGYTIEAIEHSALKMFNTKLASLRAEQAQELITRLNEAPLAKTRKTNS